MFQRASECQQKVHERRTRGKACGIRRNSIKQVGSGNRRNTRWKNEERRERKRKKGSEERKRERKREKRKKGGREKKGVVGETSAFVAGRFIINGLVFLISQHGQVEHRVAKNNLRLCVEKATESTEFFEKLEGGKMEKKKEEKRKIYIHIHRERK